MESVAPRLVAYAIIMGLLGLSVGLTYLPLDPFRIAAHLAISLAQAILVAVVFMRLRRAPPLVQVLAAGSVLWLLILFVFMFIDYTHRPPSVGPNRDFFATSEQSRSCQRTSLGQAVTALDAGPCNSSHSVF